MLQQITLDDYKLRVFDYINEFPGKMTHQIQYHFDNKMLVSESLRSLSRCGKIVCVDNRFYPVYSQVSL